MVGLPQPPSPDLLRASVARGVYAAARWSGADALLRKRNARALPILCYHSIVAEPPPPWVAAGGLHLGADRFRDHLEYLARHYAVVRLEDAIAALRRGADLPRAALAVTFDDGYANNLELAAPELERLGLPATIFLATDYLDAGGPYWWDELPAVLAEGLGRRVPVEGWGELDLTTGAGMQGALSLGAERLRGATLAARREALGRLRDALGVSPAREGAGPLRPMTWDEARAAPGAVDFGGHSAAHRVLDALTDDEVLEDLRRCRAALDARLGARAGTAFCYPEGRTGRSPALLGAAGFLGAVTATHDPAAERLAARGDDPLLLPRIGVSARTTVTMLAGKVAGLRSALGRLAP